jgi:hypothetical protein
MSTPGDFPAPRRPNLVPFAKGYDPRRGNGGSDSKTRKVRKELAKMDGKAMETLLRLFDSDDPDLQVEALKFWGKYRLPVPREATPDGTKAREAVAALGPEIAARLAALDS